MIYRQWMDFVSFPLDANRIKTREERLDLTNAVDAYSKEYTPSGLHPARIPKSMIVWDGDEFEAMEIAESGDVRIWTKQKVWELRRLNDTMEKLTYMPRHPPDD